MCSDIDGRGRFRDRRAVTMLEILFTAGILAVMVGMLLWTFSGGTRQSIRASENLTGVWVAESILSSIRERVAADPRFFLTIAQPGSGWTASDDFEGGLQLWGRAVKSEELMVLPDGTLLELDRIVPFFRNWLDGRGAAGTGVWQDENQDLLTGPKPAADPGVLSLEEQRQLAGGLSRLAVRIVVAPVKPASAGESASYWDGDAKELLRQVLVEVHRCRRLGETAPPPEPFWLRTEMLCPEESLSSAALALLSRPESWDWKRQLEEIEPQMSAATTQAERVKHSVALGDDCGRILMAVFRLTRRVDVESFRVRGRPVLPSAWRTTGLDAQIDALESSQLPVARMRRAAALREKAIEILRAYRGSSEALEDLWRQHQSFAEQLKDSESSLGSGVSTASQVGRELELLRSTATPEHHGTVVALVEKLKQVKEDVKLVLEDTDNNHLFKRAALYEYLFAGPGFDGVLDRAEQYPSLLGETLARAETAYSELASDPALPGLEAQLAGIRLAEVARASRLWAQAATPMPTASQGLEELKKQLTGVHRWGYEFVASQADLQARSSDGPTAASPLSMLVAAFPNYQAMVVSLKGLGGGPGYVVPAVRGQYGAGSISQFLDRAGETVSILLAAEKAAIPAMGRAGIGQVEIQEYIDTLKPYYEAIAKVLGRARVVGPANVPPGSKQMLAADRTALRTDEEIPATTDEGAK